LSKKIYYKRFTENQVLFLIRQLPKTLIFSNFIRQLPDKGQKSCWKSSY